jgi:hypothetical protein
MAWGAAYGISDNATLQCGACQAPAQRGCHAHPPCAMQIRSRGATLWPAADASAQAAVIQPRHHRPGAEQPRGKRRLLARYATHTPMGKV